MSGALRLGVIGLSPGNGHPYSWSAIFNGYDAAAMEHCGFPVIPRYLEKQRFPDDAIADARVTHVWTQDPALSAQVAQAACIEHVADRATDLVGQVDAVLLARDDADTHLAFARPFLEAGVPIYVDKPLALSRAEAETLIGLQRFPGQLFSCSALRYAPELGLTVAQREQFGALHCVAATVPKDWDKYAVHVIEPLLQLLPDRGAVVRSQRWAVADRVTLQLEFASGVEARISTLGATSAPLGLRVFGATGWCDLHFADTFRAFRAALQDFVDGVRARDVRIAPAAMLEVVDLIELGRQA
ncbi:Gfo/Idh/MocA family oxidoreductase [Methyloversatilis discipulorum]|uniref:Gfo/Idh/MocA family oxidoreductase n=1 Tax=Methyloversatilis discipulorum TaxID=1119528 RepID=UPI001A4DE904|nr:Gfo/Idh/MocA family oxidoreductase [Methyloversatilis discipulorum]MBL8470071.1 Gfo/Idh/MocA family oxidoreductase [Methyloversatilis discipulorum]